MKYLDTHYQYIQVLLANSAAKRLLLREVCEILTSELLKLLSSAAQEHLYNNQQVGFTPWWPSTSSHPGCLRNKTQIQILTIYTGTPFSVGKLAFSKSVM